VKVLTCANSLALAEMRLILAKVLFSFDLELLDKSGTWMSSQKVFTLWQKPDLMVELKAVKR
jgi:cytochrome P450